MGTIVGTEAADLLNGSSDDDTIYGLGGNDTIDAGEGNDTIDGGSGSDTMRGGAGDDTYYVDSLTDAVLESSGAGYDRVYAVSSFTLLDHLEELWLSGVGDYWGIGNGLNNHIVGNDGANLLRGDGGRDTLQGFGGNDDIDGGLGDDIMEGGAGDDRYTVDSINDQIIEPSGQGNDTVLAAISYKLAAGLSIEFLSATGSDVVDLVGNELAQEIRGNSHANVITGGGGGAGIDRLFGLGGNDTLIGGTGKDFLDGGSGADNMIGGGGDDTYLVDNVNDVVVAGDGYDQVVPTINYTLGAGVERLLMGGVANLTGTGNELANALDGNGGNNTLFGLAGNDGLNGYSGNDVLDGGTGADVMIGGGGNDTYYVDDAGDVVIDSGGGLVISSVSFTMSAGIRQLVLIGDMGLTGRGNDERNTITGGNGDDILIGGRGEDTINGSAGNDTASYEFDTAAVTVSLLTRTGTTGAAQGDVLQSIENLRGTNAAGDTLSGDTGANRLEGLGGNDSLSGGDGNDVLVGGAGIDAIDGGAGADIMSFEDGAGPIAVNLANGEITGSGYDGDTFTNIEGVRGTAFDDSFTGTAQMNLFQGGAGNDMFNGAGGADVIEGGAGIDGAAVASLFRASNLTAFSGSATGSFGDYQSVEYITFIDGRFISDPDGVGSQIIRLYDAVLQRAPDSVGLDFYLDWIEDQGGSLRGAANDLIGSDEFQAATGALDNAQFVDFAYQQTLARAPDAEGRAFYIQQLNGGLSRGSMIIQFSESSEHRTLTADVVARGYFNTDDSYQVVALFYDSFLGRLADVEGLTFYSERLKSGAMTISQLASDFASSSEFSTATAGMSNDQLVDYIYLNTLDRNADPNGRSYYIDQLNRGMSKAAFVQEVSLSSEHYNLLANIVVDGIQFG